jgi:N-acetylglucosaminyl-diphospho-decaprenol L-rhamnosyltransferase
MSPREAPGERAREHTLADAIELAVIILNYRTATLSADCLDSIALDLLPGMQVIVVDNASGDGSADAIAQHIEARGYTAWARVLRSPVNGGFSAGNNLALRGVQARMYVLLNSDTLVRPGALAELRRVLLERRDVGLVGPSFEDGDGTLLESCHDLPHPVRELVRTANTGLVDRMLGRYAEKPRYGELPLEPVWMPFACVAFRRDVLDTVGLLDDGFFMYFEDIDYCLRVREAGYALLYWPRARIVHLVGKSSDVTAKGAAEKRAPRYFYEARTRFYAKHFGLSGLMLANASWIAGRSLSRARQLVQRTPRAVREREARDIWINVLHPFRASSYRPRAPR